MSRHAAPAPPLTALDRCDRCNAAAVARSTKDGAELLMCGHHANANMEALSRQGFQLN
jgi:hypothetical protein